MSKSKKFVVNHTVIVVRENVKTKQNEQIEIKPGTAFEFTEQEVEDIIRLNGEDSVRKPINEDPDAFESGEELQLTKAQRKAAEAAAKKLADSQKPPKVDGVDKNQEGENGGQQEDDGI